nr:unnamed protein product [Callosobruchus chinensis]
MWWLILLIALQPISGAAISQLEPLEGPLWEEDIAEELLRKQNDINEDRDTLFRHRFHQTDHLKNKGRTTGTEDNSPTDSAADPTSDDDVSSSAAANILRRVAGKRALAMFARWGSVNSIGKNRPPIRSHLFDEALVGGSEAAQVAARGRMLGQPLRWG